MASPDRPLSPHLQVYRPQLTSVLSIMHRMTGLALAGGALMLVWWLLAAAAGPEAYDGFRSFAGSWLGRLALAAWTFALFYHLCNGIRHLFWDAGRGYGLPAVHAGGWAVVAASLVLTAAALVWSHAVTGAS